MTQTVARRTIYMPKAVEELVLKNAREGESFSAAAARMVEQGAVAEDKENRPDWIGSGEGPGDLGINAEKYLGLKPWEPDDKDPR